jgi:polar amino acid transport system substrate-binding protein
MARLNAAKKLALLNIFVIYRVLSQSLKSSFRPYSVYVLAAQMKNPAECRFVSVTYINLRALLFGTYWAGNKIECGKIVMGAWRIMTAKDGKILIAVVLVGLLSWVFISYCSALLQRPVLTIYTYNNFPPYIINPKTQQGISYDWVRAVNRHLQHIQLQVRPLTRPELDSILTHSPALILWTLPRFFPEHPDYRASDDIFLDSFILISRQTNPVRTFSDIKGKRLCQISGWVFPELNVMLDRGDLIRVPGANYDECLTMLEQHKLDLIWFSQSVYLTYPKTLREDKLYVMDPPIEIISRSIVITPSYQQWTSELNKAIQAIRQDEAWKQALLQYGSHDFVDLFTLDIQQLRDIHLKTE